MTFRSRLTASLGGLSLALLPATALAQEPGVHVDPGGNSPPGVVYQLPLDNARGDAAPHGNTGGNGNGGSGHSGSGSSSGSNSSGSSGAGAGGVGGGGGTGGAGGTGGGGSGSGSGGSGGSASGGGASVSQSSIHSENGLGSSSQVPGVSGSGSVSGDRTSSDGGAGIAAPLGLLVAVVLLAGTAAVAGRRVARQRQA